MLLSQVATKRNTDTVSSTYTSVMLTEDIYRNPNANQKRKQKTCKSSWY